MRRLLFGGESFVSAVHCSLPSVAEFRCGDFLRVNGRVTAVDNGARASRSPVSIACTAETRAAAVVLAASRIGLGATHRRSGLWLAWSWSLAPWSAPNVVRFLARPGEFRGSSTSIPASSTSIRAASTSVRAASTSVTAVSTAATAVSTCVTAVSTSVRCRLYFGSAPFQYGFRILHRHHRLEHHGFVYSFRITASSSPVIGPSGRGRAVDSRGRVVSTSASLSRWP